MENNRTKQLLPLQTVIGAINLNIKGRMQTFNVLYSGAMLPWVDGKMLFVPEKRYNAMLRDFFVNEGKEYIIPSVTQIAQDRANVINAYTEGRLGGMYAKEEEKETQQVAEERSSEQEVQVHEEQEVEQREEPANDESEPNENRENYEESTEENSEVDESLEKIEESEQEGNSDEYGESELGREEIQDNITNQHEQEKEIEVEEIDDDDLLNFSIDNGESGDEEEEESASNEMQSFMVDSAPQRETRSSRYAQRVAEYRFSDESLDDLKEIIRDQNKIMMHQNEIIMNLNDAVVKQQEAIDTFKGKINNANLFVKSNQKKNYIGMIICLLITIATIIGMQLYAPKMESAIQLDPNTDAEVHIVIHNDDGTDSFERIGTITITDGKLTVGE